MGEVARVCDTEDDREIRRASAEECCKGHVPTPPPPPDRETTQRRYSINTAGENSCGLQADDVEDRSPARCVEELASEKRKQVVPIRGSTCRGSTCSMGRGVRRGGKHRRNSGCAANFRLCGCSLLRQGDRDRV